MPSLRIFLKSALPVPLWTFSKNLYNSCLYRYRWRGRKVVTFVRSGQAISFLIVNSNDYIQSVQAKGLFYEEEDLLKIAPHFKRGGVFVDIGANTGQHSIYFTKFLGASKAILFEPVPLTCRILNENINLNGLTDICDLSHLGLGLSDLDSVVGFAVSYNNLGTLRNWVWKYQNNDGRFSAIWSAC